MRGEQRAWNTLIDRYARLVYSVPRRYRLSEADADDVFQAVWISVHRSLDSLKDHSRLSAWLLTTAHRESWRVGRKANKYPGLDDVIANVAAPEDDQIVAWERQDIVHKGLAELGGKCEKLLRALFLEADEPSYEEIAKRMGMKIGSIGPTRARCFEKLESILASLGMFDEQAD